MVSLEMLPDGLLIDIVTCGSLEAVDVINFGRTCLRFHSLCSTNSVWKSMCTLRWPYMTRQDGELMSLVGRLDMSTDENVHNSKSDVVSPHWMAIFRQVNSVFLQLRRLLREHFQEDLLDDDYFKPFEDLVDNFTYDLVSCVLLEIMKSDCKSANLTDKYYGNKAFHRMHCKWVTPQLEKLILPREGCGESSDGISRLLQGAILIEKWLNPKRELDFESVVQFVVDAAEKTKQHHQLSCSSSLEGDGVQLSRSKLASLNHIFFNELKFSGNEGNYFNIKNSFIHEVIRTRMGIPILLSIIYKEIAQRVGLELECMNNPGHFVLRWQIEELSSANPTVSDIARCFRYIDVFNGGRILEFDDLDNRMLLVKKATISEVLHRVSLNVDAHSRISDQGRMNLQRSLDVFNLCILFDSNSHRVRSKRMLLHYQMNINLSSTLEDNRLIPEDVRTDLSMPPSLYSEKMFLERIKKKEEQIRNYQRKIMLRSDPKNHEVNYSVGMVMKHRLYDYICVIRGWDNFCNMPRQWVRQMGVDQLERTTKQPFYNVLVDEDESQRYAAEDNLECISHQSEIDHPEIGRYFSSFVQDESHVSYYKTNAELGQCFPEDLNFTIEQASKVPV